MFLSILNPGSASDAFETQIIRIQFLYTRASSLMGYTELFTRALMDAVQFLGTRSTRFPLRLS